MKARFQSMITMTLRLLVVSLVFSSQALAGSNPVELHHDAPFCISSPAESEGFVDLSLEMPWGWSYANQLFASDVFSPTWELTGPHDGWRFFEDDDTRTVAYFDFQRHLEEDIKLYLVTGFTTEYSCSASSVCPDLDPQALAMWAEAVAGAVVSQDPSALPTPPCTT